jgi:hypothetical protein
MGPFVNGIGFRFVEPMQRPRKAYLRADYRLRRVGVPIGLLNTRFPQNQTLIMRNLWRLIRVPGTSTFPLAGIINEAVRQMPPDRSYVNVGTWQGFTLFAGMSGNPTRRCVGIDNFSGGGCSPTGPDLSAVRETFLRRFERWRSPAHEFVECDYVDYFDHLHRGPIGVYFYDGDHSFENHLHGLEIAEPYFADGCLIPIVSANSAAVREATELFVASREGLYEVILDQPVANKGHPTFGNGLVIIRRIAPGGPS